ncbi:DUF3349 domain-containing protein [Skermania sp. ID1734]|uniref:DUF3349 domain-containing protein n=1 Tax=Skermania sp. ID1734 TaxID=2597516 RepID=UPI001180BFD8|nr:DUF3349 domain-containing protein [Skermania sp. ID1734]TSD95120.1 DUF3349 domain-containing protein [Skermania sp. ID1734]
MTESKTSILQSVLNWLRAGYPQGVPHSDYVALFAVLHRRLTDSEVRQVAEQLVADRSDADAAIDRAEIEAAIAQLAKEQPGPDDVQRVASRLAAGGWPLTHPDDLARPSDAAAAD